MRAQRTHAGHGSAVLCSRRCEMAGIRAVDSLPHAHQEVRVKRPPDRLLGHARRDEVRRAANPTGLENHPIVCHPNSLGESRAGDYRRSRLGTKWLDRPSVQEAPVAKCRTDMHDTPKTRPLALRGGLGSDIWEAHRTPRPEKNRKSRNHGAPTPRNHGAPEPRGHGTPKPRGARNHETPELTNHKTTDPRHRRAQGRRTLAEEGCGFVVAVLRHGVQLAEGVGERHAHDGCAAQGDHFTPGFVDDGVCGMQAQSRGQHAVKCRG